MNPTITASIANQRHADLIADALDYRRSHAARLPRPGRTKGAPTLDRRYVFGLRALRSWIAAGML